MLAVTVIENTISHSMSLILSYNKLPINAEIVCADNYIYPQISLHKASNKKFCSLY